MAVDVSYDVVHRRILSPIRVGLLGETPTDGGLQNAWLPRHFRTEPRWIRPIAYPSEVEAVGIPTSLNSQVAFRQSIAVVATCVDQHLEALGVEMETLRVEVRNEVCSTRTMLPIAPIIVRVSSRVVT